jgi:O-acetyl-ADP-ribose deacetylase (regulator of RNase III)
MSVKFKKVNAVSALIDGEVDVLIHVCNNKGVMGSGIALEIKNRIPDAFVAYKQIPCDLGTCTFGWNFENTETTYGFVCNMVAQDGYGQGVRHINYGALAQCLSKVKALDNSLRIGLPYKMGADRAGGDWNIVLEMVEFILKDFDITVYEWESV